MWDFENVGAVASTQQSARDRLADHAPKPFVLYSQAQQKGHGQHGRVWVRAEESLACSFAWPEPAGSICPGAGLPPWALWVSLAAATAAEQALGLPPCAVQIKWPNDLIYRGRKSGGVLVSRVCPAQTPWLIAGIGLNLRWQSEPEGFEASGLLEQTTQPCNDELIQALLAQLGQALAPLQAGPPVGSDWEARLAGRDWLRGRAVRLRDPHTQALICEGIAQGVDGLGWLAVQRPDGAVRSMAIGEASVCDF